MAAKRPPKKRPAPKKGKAKKGNKTLTRLVIGIMGVLCLAFTLLAGYVLMQGPTPNSQRAESGSRLERKIPARAEGSTQERTQKNAAVERLTERTTRGGGISGRAPEQTATPAERTGARTANSPVEARTDALLPSELQKNEPAPSAASVTAETGASVRGPVSPGALPYEEALDAPLEEGVKQVDYALIQTLSRLGIDRSRLQMKVIENRHAGSEPYHFQRMRLHLAESPERFVKGFTEALQAWAERARLNRRADDLIEIRVDNVPTHELELSLFEEGDATPQETVKGARLAIVIDDIGENMSAVRELLALDFPVTFAIWPRSTHGLEAAEAIHRAGREVMIHLPMEPEKYPQVKPGRGALFVRMSHDDIVATVRDAIRRVPYAVGLNNHMGSKFTQNVRGVRAVCDALEGGDLFVLDSVTHPRTVFQREARKAGLPSLKRNVFLDVINDRRNVVFQLDKAVRLAQAQGTAVAIGHPLPATIEGLREWGRSRDRSVQIVTARELARDTEDANP